MSVTLKATSSARGLSVADEGDKNDNDSKAVGALVIHHQEALAWPLPGCHAARRHSVVVEEEDEGWG